MRPRLIEVVLVLVVAGCNSILGFDLRPSRDAGGAGGGGDAGGLQGGGGIADFGGMGGLGGMGGSGGTVASSCNALTGSATAVYEIDPDLEGPIRPFDVHCDMDFDAGGWTLIVSTAGGMGPATSTPGVVLPGAHKHMPTAAMTVLAAASSQVHVRTTGEATTRSATSTPESLPVRNLRLAKLLERTAADYDDGHWVMGTALTHANMTRNRNSQPCADAEAADVGYPQIYQACDNANGLHIVGTESTWSLAAQQPEPMEVYVR